jgi:hypothetical protein
LSPKTIWSYTSVFCMGWEGGEKLGRRWPGLCLMDVCWRQAVNCSRQAAISWRSVVTKSSVKCASCFPQTLQLYVGSNDDYC